MVRAVSYTHLDVYKRQWCECIEVLAIKIFSKDNAVHPYAVIVVLTHTITQNPKVSQVHQSAVLFLILLNSTAAV